MWAFSHRVSIFLPVLLLFGVVTRPATATGPQGIYYKILGVSNDATSAEIKAAYRSLSLQYHPDKNRHDDQDMAESIFREIAAAYGVLSDKGKRKAYDDAIRMRGSSGGGGSGGQQQQQQQQHHEYRRDDREGRNDDESGGSSGRAHTSKSDKSCKTLRGQLKDFVGTHFSEFCDSFRTFFQFIAGRLEYSGLFIDCFAITILYRTSVFVHASIHLYQVLCCECCVLVCCSSHLALFGLWFAVKYVAAQLLDPDINATLTDFGDGWYSGGDELVQLGRIPAGFLVIRWLHKQVADKAAKWFVLLIPLGMATGLYIRLTEDGLPY